MISLPHTACLAANATFVIGCARITYVSIQSHRTFRIALFVGPDKRSVGSPIRSRHAKKTYRLIYAIFGLRMLVGLATNRRFFAEWAYFPGVVGAQSQSFFRPSQKRAQSEWRKLDILPHKSLIGARFYLIFGRGYLLRSSGNPSDIRSYCWIRSPCHSAQLVS